MTLETYLKTATKGLYGRKKLEVKTEIEGNIKELALEYQIAGLSQTQAISQAILDFGEARDLNAGMVKVHTMPKMIKAVLLAGLLSSVALVGVSSSLAEILTSSVGIYKNCTTDEPHLDGSCVQPQSWMKLADFTADIGKAGGTFKLHTTNSRILSFSVTFAGDHAIDIAYIRLPEKFDPEIAQKHDNWFNKDNEIWVNLSYTLEQIARYSFLDITFEGWENPKLHVGKTILNLKTGNDGTLAYYTYFYSAITDIFYPSSVVTFIIDPPISGVEANRQNRSIRKFKHQIKVNDKPGTIYAVFTQVQSKTNGELDRQPVSTGLISIAPVAADETITVWLNEPTLDFVSTLAETEWKLKTPNFSPTALLKLNGRLDSKAPKLEVVVPAVTKSVAKF
jgi:hypothetical protein